MPTSKRKNRSQDRRRLRRILNKTVGVVGKAARRLLRHRYGDGIHQRSLGRCDD